MHKKNSIMAGGFAVLLIALLGWKLPAYGQTQPSALNQAVAPMSQDDLPDAVLRGDLLAVAIFDFEKGDKTAWNNAWMVISGGRPTTRPLGPDDPLPLGIEQALGPIFKIGAARLAYAVSMNNGTAIITLGIRFRDGVSDTAANAWIRKSVPGSRGFEHEGPWLVKRLNANAGGAAAARPLSSQADEVRQDLNCWGEDVPVKVVYLSSEPVKKQLLKGGPPPEVVRGMANLYWNAKYVYLGAQLGVSPQVEVRWVAPDADGADAVIKEFAATCQGFKQPGNGVGLPPAFNPVFDLLKPVREDNIARLSLGHKELSGIFAAVVTASMTPQNSPSGQQFASQSSVAADWAPTDAAIDSASAQMRLILSAIAEYDKANNSLPASLDDLVTAKLVPGPEIFHNPRTGKDGGFLYVKPDGINKLADITDRAKTPILFEEKDGQADQAGLVGYADGKVSLGKAK